MPHAPSTSMQRAAAALLAGLAASMCTAGESVAASSLSVAITPARPAASPAPMPAGVAIRAAFSADRRGALPPTLRALALAMPAGFATALAGTSACGQAALELSGPGACPAGSKLGSGSASFIYVAGALRIAASTRELSVFRGAGDAILAYVKVSQPTTFSVVLPGRLGEQPAPAGPLLSLDLGRVARIEGGGSAIVTRLAVDLARGLAAGPCPWTFGARLDYDGAGTEQRTADAPCETGPDVTAPLLRASARDGTTAGGARFALRLSEAATVRVALERRAGGRWIRVLRTSAERPAGSSVLRIQRAGGRALPHGRYRARLRATDAAGLPSAKRNVAFDLRSGER